MPMGEKLKSCEVYNATPPTTTASDATTIPDSSMRSPKNRSITIVTIGATFRTTMIAPIEAWSSASMDEASMSVKRKGIVSDQRSTSRYEPKCRPHGVTMRQMVVKAICTMTMVMGMPMKRRKTSLLMTSMPAEHSMKAVHAATSAKT